MATKTEIAAREAEAAAKAAQALLVKHGREFQKLRLEALAELTPADEQTDGDKPAAAPKAPKASTPAVDTTNLPPALDSKEREVEPEHKVVVVETGQKAVVLRVDRRSKRAVIQFEDETKKMIVTKKLRVTTPAKKTAAVDKPAASPNKGNGKGKATATAKATETSTPTEPHASPEPSPEPANA